jgi:hypothetical protein
MEDAEDGSCSAGLQACRAGVAALKGCATWMTLEMDGRERFPLQLIPNA